MEIDELEKRLSWLDIERQKDKKLIAELSDTIESLKEEQRKQIQKIKTMESEIKAIGSTALRIDNVDSKLSEFKGDMLKQLVDLDKKLPVVEKKFEKQRKEDLDLVNKRILEQQFDMKGIADLKKAIQARVDEEVRITQKVDEVSKSILPFAPIEAELQRQQKLLISDLQLESKRISDIQIETSTLRKRIEEDRNSTAIFKDSIQKIDQKIIELQKMEVERKQNQAAFIEKQTLLQVEREHTWKAWQEKFAELDALGNRFNSQLLALEETHRSVKTSLAEFVEVNEKINRRINEITEMNRLNEERFRQEWVLFRAEDQKRWTNYNLNFEETQRDESRSLTHVEDRLTQLEDASQEYKDALQVTQEEMQKQIKGYLALSQELLDSFAQSLGKRK